MRYRSRVMVLHTSYIVYHSIILKKLSRYNHQNCLFWICPHMMRSTSPASFSLSRSSFSSLFQQPKSPRLLCKGSTNPTAGLVATVLRIFNGESWKLLASRGLILSLKNHLMDQRWALIGSTARMTSCSCLKKTQRLVEVGCRAKLREKGIVGPLLLHNLQENNKVEVQLNPMYFVIP